MERDTNRIRFLGLREYAECWEKMKKFTEERDPGTCDEIWLLEHHPVYTQGLNGKAEHLLNPGDIPVIHSDRGGQATYHGPGQLILYPLLDIRRRKIGVRRLVTLLERSAIETLKQYGIQSYAKPEAPGVYVDSKKIASIGIRIRRGYSYHGMSLNVNVDLAPFDGINICGFPSLGATRLADLGGPHHCHEVAIPLVHQFLNLLDEPENSKGIPIGNAWISRRIHDTLGTSSGSRPGTGFATLSGRHAGDLLKMSETPDFNAPSRTTPETHQRNQHKLSRIPVKVVPSVPLRKPPWLRVKAASLGKVRQIKKLLRDQKLYSVCEEAACPNLCECFSKGTATFMIMGDLCTRRCPFCDVAHGKPKPLDPEEPGHLAETIAALKLRYVVITSVDRDDLRDGGARHFLDCIQAIRSRNPSTKVEFLVPDFRGHIELAIRILSESPPDVFNHNLETVPRLYKKARPGASYPGSLELLERFHDNHPDIPTKSGLMLGLGEEIEAVEQVMRDLRASQCSMLTLGQYLQPSRVHLPVARYVTPEEFDRLAECGRKMGFAHVASGPLVRSSYHADIQAQELIG